jgi:hypothetical protein
MTGLTEEMQALLYEMQDTDHGSVQRKVHETARRWMRLRHTEDAPRMVVQYTSPLDTSPAGLVYEENGSTMFLNWYAKEKKWYAIGGISHAKGLSSFEVEGDVNMADTFMKAWFHFQLLD